MPGGVIVDELSGGTNPVPSVTAPNIQPVTGNGLLDAGVGLLQTGASIYNTYQQTKINDKNLEYNREANAQNQYNLENAWQIAAKDIEKAGLSKALLNGGASGYQQVAFEGKAPQSDLGSVLSSTLIALGQLKNQQEQTDILRQQANIQNKAVEYSHEEAMAKLDQTNKHFDAEMKFKEIQEANTVADRRALAQESVREFEQTYAEGIRQFDLQMQQKDAQFLASLNAEMERFVSEYGLSTVKFDFERYKYTHDYNFNLMSFLESEANDMIIAENKNQTSRFVALMGFLGNFMNGITRGIYTGAFTGNK